LSSRVSDRLWVLRASYGCQGAELAEVEKILSAQQIEVEGAGAAWLALEDFRASKADFAECLIGRLPSGRTWHPVAPIAPSGTSRIGSATSRRNPERPQPRWSPS
jgi:hypothetical protein